jgi:hypothetical protein
MAMGISQQIEVLIGKSPINGGCPISMWNYRTVLGVGSSMFSVTSMDHASPCKQLSLSSSSAMFKSGKKTSSKTISYYTSRVPGVYGPKSSKIPALQVQILQLWMLIIQTSKCCPSLRFIA